MPDVFLYLYDLSGGLAKALSPVFLGKQIHGIWHTSAVIYNREFFFCQSGIQYARPGCTNHGEPLQKINMGYTNLSEEEVLNHIKHLGTTIFKPGDYSLFEHNCNSFSDCFIFFLTGKHIPSYILELPREVLSTPISAGLQASLNSPPMAINSAEYTNTNGAGAEKVTNHLDHSYQQITKLFRPILFDEPVSSEISASRINLMWPTDIKSSLQATYAVMICEFLNGKNQEANLNPEYFSLLALDELITKDQCHIVCELFRVAVWRDPNLLMSLLTDQNRHLHKLASVPLPSIKGLDYYDLEMSRAKLLCNCLGLSTQWAIMEDENLKFDLGPIIHICLLLLNHESHHQMNESSSMNGNLDCGTQPTKPLPEHRQVGLALAHNLALFPMFVESDALELGTYLLHLATTELTSYKQPVEVIYLLRTIYFLVVRFDMLADVAKITDLQNHINEYVKQVKQIDYRDNFDGSCHLSRQALYDELGTEPDLSVSIDQVVAERLLDFLNNSTVGQ